jgi:hypothetical protein
MIGFYIGKFVFYLTYEKQQSKWILDIKRMK